MRISNIDWLKKRIGFIRKLGEQTARQRQIIDLLDNEAGLTEQERKLLHVLATAEKNELQAQENARKQANQKRMEGKTQRRERNHRLFLAAGLLNRGRTSGHKNRRTEIPKRQYITETLRQSGSILKQAQIIINSAAWWCVCLPVFNVFDFATRYARIWHRCVRAQCGFRFTSASSPTRSLRSVAGAAASGGITLT
ncbi:hypothetical protein [Escherichia coli]|uniref:hypothetical protein n=16 Tax=Gammaproteobacteria TaxID=1236 RepID=UPI00155250E0|nr:hypothetical protein [Escherichia coli]